MKISVKDTGSGIMSQFAQAIGAKIDGRFIRIPENKGGGYITGFAWGRDLRMALRNYYLKEEVLIDRTNEIGEGEDQIIFLLGGIFPSLVADEKELLPEPASVLICKHEVSSLLAMPSNTSFSSITIAVARAYLRTVFGSLAHPVVTSILESTAQFAFETAVSAEMVKTAGEMINQHLPETMESHYYKLRCEELLCYVFAQLVQREETATSGMNINDIKAIYAIKLRLQANFDVPPNISSLAKDAGMSEPKLRKLFKQTFGKGVFDYFQSMRMQEAARLLKGNGLTVSEVGYQLGFTNLSHFSRVFEQYNGMKPKKYSAS